MREVKTTMNQRSLAPVKREFEIPTIRKDFRKEVK
jgi:hypothetical protein